MEFVDVALLQAIEDETDGALVSAYDGFLDNGLGAIDFRAAVAGLVNVSVGFEFICLEIFGRQGIDGLSEREFETVGFDTHLMNFEGDFAGPDEPLEGER